jgi:hypothetical protein
MDEDSRPKDWLEADTRSGDDRRMPTERRHGRHRLLERHARREGTETDRRRRERRARENASRLSFLWRWAKG